MRKSILQNDRHCLLVITRVSPVFLGKFLKWFWQPLPLRNKHPMASPGWDSQPWGQRPYGARGFSTSTSTKRTWEAGWWMAVWWFLLLLVGYNRQLPNEFFWTSLGQWFWSTIWHSITCGAFLDILSYLLRFGVLGTTYGSKYSEPQEVALDVQGMRIDVFVTESWFQTWHCSSRLVNFLLTGLESYE